MGSSVAARIRQRGTGRLRRIAATVAVPVTVVDVYRRLERFVFAILDNGADPNQPVGAGVPGGGALPGGVDVPGGADVPGGGGVPGGG